MRKVLVVVDTQECFVNGDLGSKEAAAAAPRIAERARQALKKGWAVVLLQDTHAGKEEYLKTQEGRNLPVPHAEEGTEGWQLIPALTALDPEEYKGVLAPGHAYTLKKPAFGSPALVGAFFREAPEQVEFCGLVTDICVIVNVLAVKAFLPEVPLAVRADCCAGLTPESHEAALTVLANCQVEIIRE